MVFSACTCSPWYTTIGIAYRSGSSLVLNRHRNEFVVGRGHLAKISLYSEGCWQFCCGIHRQAKWKLALSSRLEYSSIQILFPILQRGKRQEAEWSTGQLVEMSFWYGHNRVTILLSKLRHEDPIHRPRPIPCKAARGLNHKRHNWPCVTGKHSPRASSTDRAGRNLGRMSFVFPACQSLNLQISFP